VQLDGYLFHAKSKIGVRGNAGVHPGDQNVRRVDVRINHPQGFQNIRLPGIWFSDKKVYPFTL